MYFNCGPFSGASQPHKHMQCVPLPLARNDTTGDALSSPFEEAILQKLVHSKNVPGSIPQLPFAHVVVGLEAGTGTHYGEMLAELYQTMIAWLEKRLDGKWSRNDSYNIIMTTDYMMIVPRSKEWDANVSCNAMGYAGSFFLARKEEIERVKSCGPSSILRNLGYAPINDHTFTCSDNNDTTLS